MRYLGAGGVLLLSWYLIAHFGHIYTLLRYYIKVHIFKGSWRDVVRRRAEVRFCKCFGKIERRYELDVLMRAELYYICVI